MHGSLCMHSTCIFMLYKEKTNHPSFYLVMYIFSLCFIGSPSTPVLYPSSRNNTSSTNGVLDCDTNSSLPLPASQASDGRYFRLDSISSYRQLCVAKHVVLCAFCKLHQFRVFPKTFAVAYNLIKQLNKQLIMASKSKEACRWAFDRLVEDCILEPSAATPGQSRRCQDYIDPLTFREYQAFRFLAHQNYTKNIDNYGLLAAVTNWLKCPHAAELAFVHC